MQSWSGRAAAVFAVFSVVGFSTRAELLPPGHLPEPPGVHFLTGATVVVRPGEEIVNGGILIRGGRIAAVGSDLQAPEEARVWELDGQTIYAGFIDPYLTLRSGHRAIEAQRFS